MDNPNYQRVTINHSPAKPLFTIKGVVIEAINTAGSGSRKHKGITVCRQSPQVQMGHGVVGKTKLVNVTELSLLTNEVY